MNDNIVNFRKVKYEKLLESGCCPISISIDRRQQEWLRNQMDLQKRGFPNAIDCYGKPKAGELMSLPWLYKKILDEAINKKMK